MLALWANLHVSSIQAKNRTPNLPFGVFSLPDGTIATQDFAYNLLFLQGVREHVVPHPYRFTDQEKMMRTELPEIPGGLTHAYSPVAFVLALPLLALPASHAYALFTLLSSLSIPFLFWALLPRMESRLQIYAFCASVLSICTIGALTTGQTSVITTALLGLFWCLLNRSTTFPPLLNDILIAVLFWMICLKPSIAIIPFALLVGARAWRSLALALLALPITWLFTATYYGGFWSSLSDYFFLLNHYNNAEFPAFMKRAYETAAEQHDTLLLFSLDRLLVLGSSVALVTLRWTRRITLSQQLQGMIGIFLLFSPYLMGSEYFILALLVVESSFFKSRTAAVILAKLVMLVAILNLRSGVTFPVEIGLFLKWILFAWILIEGFHAKLAQPSRASNEMLQGVLVA